MSPPPVAPRLGSSYQTRTQNAPYTHQRTLHPVQTRYGNPPLSSYIQQPSQMPRTVSFVTQPLVHEPSTQVAEEIPTARTLQSRFQRPAQVYVGRPHFVQGTDLQMHNPREQSRQAYTPYGSDLYQT